MKLKILALRFEFRLFVTIGMLLRSGTKTYDFDLLRLFMPALLPYSVSSKYSESLSSTTTSQMLPSSTSDLVLPLTYGDGTD